MASGSVEKVVSGWGSPMAVSLPFVSSLDGILLGAYNPSNSNNCYVYIKDNGVVIMRSMSSSGYGFGATVPIVAGHTYEQEKSSNAGTSYTFIPFL